MVARDQCTLQIHGIKAGFHRKRDALGTVSKKSSIRKQNKSFRLRRWALTYYSENTKEGNAYTFLKLILLISATETRTEGKINGDI